MTFVKDLDTPLLRLSRGNVFSGRDAASAVHIFGGTGQGKTSGPGRMLAGAYLRAGYGGVVTVAKFEDIALWKSYCKEHRRAASLVVFDENEGFNFLTYEMARQGTEGIGTVTECLLRVLEAAKRASATTSQKGEEEFWQGSKRQLIRYSIAPIYAATGAVTIPDIIRFINTAPTNPTDPTSAEWQKRSFMYSVMDAATRCPKVKLSDQLMRDTIDWWAEEYPNIPDKTRGNMVITVSTVLDRFKHGRLQKAFCGKTTIVPEMSFHGAVILLAMPTLTWNEDGVIAQQLFKFMWQRAVLNRNSLEEKHRERPVFLFSDEAQETVSAYDGEFLSMCRGSKCCVTYLTQTLPTYYAKMGGDNPRDAAHALVGKFMTNIFHSNSCPETNEYASRVIGKVMKRHGNYSAGNSESINSGMSSGESVNTGTSHNYGGSSNASSSMGGPSRGHGSSHGFGSSDGRGNNWGANRGRGTSNSESKGYSESMEYQIEPGDFGRILKNGGRENNYLVTGVWFQSGRIFKGGTNMMVETFRQK